MQLGLAFRAFFVALLDRQRAERIQHALAGGEVPSDISQQVSPDKRVPSPKTERNDAITLLATLQRESRLVDIVKEPLADYSDAQVGAAARDVLRDCGEVLDRLFALQPVSDQAEGASVELPAEVDAGRYRIGGKVGVEATARIGSLVHHGWQATRCELPQWNGSPASVMVIAPAELEVK